jgi:adenylate cyclase
MLFDKKPSDYNPLICNGCEKLGKRLHISVETELCMLFADIRGSTPLAESMDSADFARLINRFYIESTHVLVHNYAVVDKLAGDQVSGYFVPGLAGKDFVHRSVDTAVKLLEVTGYSGAEDPWVPVGIGINTGVANFGFIGSDEGMSDLTALGDAVNVAARLASNAAAGEVLLSQSTVQKAELDTSILEKRTVELKGKSEAMDVWVMRVE